MRRIIWHPKKDMRRVVMEFTVTDSIILQHYRYIGWKFSIRRCANGNRHPRSSRRPSAECRRCRSHGTTLACYRPVQRWRAAGAGHGQSDGFGQSPATPGKLAREPAHGGCATSEKHSTTASHRYFFRGPGEFGGQTARTGAQPAVRLGAPDRAWPKPPYLAHIPGGGRVVFSFSWGDPTPCGGAL